MPRVNLSRIVVAALAVLGAAAAGAHDIPTDVTLQTFVKPDGRTLQFVVRVPMEALQDMRFPVEGPGYLDLEAARAGRVLTDAADLWVGENVELYEEGRQLPPLELRGVRVSLPSDRSFTTFDNAVAHIAASPLSASTRIVWQQAMLDMLFEAPIQSETASFSIRPRHARLGMRVVTVLRYLPPGRAERAFQYRGEPGLVRLDPRWHQAALRFVEEGFFHILDGLDHLLFLACLVIPLRKLRELVVVVTSFTVAHSITLIASAYGFVPDSLWFPPLVELLIAVSIVYMALENIVGARVQRRWWITFAFGLVHGFGFSFVLRETLQFAGSHLLTSLVSFNIGVELGQIFVLILLVPALDWLLRKVVPERLGTILLSAIVAHTSWHWMAERATALGEYNLVPGLVPEMAALLPWLAPIALLTGLAVRGLRNLRHPAAAESPP
ncbi:MAG: HupE/UreJ family protein [Acidobacteriota bacterium]|nr:HupE/UreJ family protein [Acidobacteriota bacterium]